MENSFNDALLLDDVLNVNALEARLQDLGVWCQTAVQEKREMIDAYLLLCRSQEEITMLTEDIRNFVSFDSTTKASLIVQLQTQIEPDTRYNRGIKSLLHALLLDASSLLERAKQAYSSMLQERDM